jgi:hypothetical protein
LSSCIARARTARVTHRARLAPFAAHPRPHASRVVDAGAKRLNIIIVMKPSATI